MLVKNIRNLPSIETGGTENRLGIDYQDYIAANLFLTMLAESNLAEVWCETHDDITLIWDRDVEEVEFIQVKKRENQWAVHCICNREKKLVKAKETEDGIEAKTEQNTTSRSSKRNKDFTKVTTKSVPSILERSLANDRLLDGTPVWFRIITEASTNETLKPLRSERGSVERSTSDPKFEKLLASVNAKLPEVKSPNGNGARFWLERTLWETVGPTRNVENEILRKIDLIATKMDETLHPEHKQKLSNILVRKMFTAGASKIAEEKRFLKKSSIDWMRDQINTILNTPVSVPSHGFLQEKMSLAKLDSYYSTAIEERRKFSAWRLGSPYAPGVDQSLIVSEITSELTRLKLDLDIGNYKTSMDFYKECLRTTQELSRRFGIPTHVVDGCMYDIANRCGHRWIAE